MRNAFDVTQPAQDAALASLGDAERDRAPARARTPRRAPTWSSARSALGLTIAPGPVANFVYAEVGGDARALFEALLREGVIVRPLGAFGAPEAIRVTVGTTEENAAFADALGRVLALAG